MGEVYRAYDREQHRIVAVKRLSAHLADDIEFEQRFRREAYSVARLRSPHIIPIHRYGEINRRLYMEMRYVEGGDLAELIARDTPVSPVRAVAVLEQLASALDEAHAAGLVHRDVKPSNVLLDATVEDFCYLADFGITRPVATRRSNSLTRTGAVLGSLAYMAPEQFDGGVVPQSDVYSLTCLFFELLTARKPYEGDRLPALMHAHMNALPPRPSTYNPATDLFDEIIAAGMAKDVSARFDSAGALARAARAALNRHRGADTAVHPGPQPRKSRGLRPPDTPAIVVTATDRCPRAESVATAARDLADDPGWPPPPPHTGARSTPPSAGKRLTLPLAAAALVAALVAATGGAAASHASVGARTPTSSTLIPLPIRPTAAPSLTPSPTASPVVADAVFAGRSSGNELTVAVGVKGRRAAGYLCDGRNVEAWLEGEIAGGHLTLHGRDPGTTLESTADQNGLLGSITLRGNKLPFAAQAATGAAGLYQIRRTVKGITDRIGWIVLPDGKQVGIRNAGGTRTPAPFLDPTTRRTQVDGADLPADRISGSTTVLGS